MAAGSPATLRGRSKAFQAVWAGSVIQSFEPGGAAVVIGASGGIGSALVAVLVKEPNFDTIFALARGFPDQDEQIGKLRRGRIDLLDEASIAQSAARLPAQIRLVIVATGLLHEPNSLSPEKTYRALSSDGLLRSYQVNTVGPALVAKHMLPLLLSGSRAVFAVLSARVGSVGDNRVGGWHAYRASKAALNMIIRNLAIETTRRHPETLCVGLHPGTVDTGLSRPFQGAIPPEQLFTPAQSAAHLLRVVDGLMISDSGSLLAWDGSIVPA